MSLNKLFLSSILSAMGIFGGLSAMAMENFMNEEITLVVGNSGTLGHIINKTHKQFYHQNIKERDGDHCTWGQVESGEEGMCFNVHKKSAGFVTMDLIPHMVLDTLRFTQSSSELEKEIEIIQQKSKEKTQIDFNSFPVLSEIFSIYPSKLSVDGKLEKELIFSNDEAMKAFLLLISSNERKRKEFQEKKILLNTDRKNPILDIEHIQADFTKIDLPAVFERKGLNAANIKEIQLEFMSSRTLALMIFKAADFLKKAHYLKATLSIDLVSVSGNKEDHEDTLLKATLFFTVISPKLLASISCQSFFSLINKVIDTESLDEGIKPTRKHPLKCFDHMIPYQQFNFLQSVHFYKNKTSFPSESLKKRLGVEFENLKENLNEGRKCKDIVENHTRQGYIYPMLLRFSYVFFIKEFFLENFKTYSNELGFDFVSFDFANDPLTQRINVPTLVLQKK